MQLRILLLLLLSRRMLVIMHPNLEDLPANTKLGAKRIHLRLILPLNPPPDLLRKINHLHLLLRREFRPEPLLGRRSHEWHMDASGHGRRSRETELFAGRIGGRAAAGVAEGHHSRGRARREGMDVLRMRRRLGSWQEKRDSSAGGHPASAGVVAAVVVVVEVKRIVAFPLTAVEAPMAAAGSAFHRVGGTGHEFAASIEHVAAMARCVIAETLSVLHRRWFSGDPRRSKV